MIKITDSTSRVLISYITTGFTRQYGQITVDNIFDLIVHAMEEVEKFGHKTGQEKKQIVIDIVNEAVLNSNNSDLMVFTSTFLDGTIDNLVSASKKKIKINIAKGILSRLISCCR